MSFPNIPNVTPTISLSRADAVNLIKASIAFEELGLAHLVNAEAEKIQAALGTLSSSSPYATNLSDLLATNESVNQTLRTAVMKEMLLQFKLEDILQVPVVQPTIHFNMATAIATFDGVTVTASDSAYYYTENQ